MISGHKQLRPCPTGERVERRWCSRDPQGSDDSLCGFLFGGNCCLTFQGTITDASLPGNAPLRWLQSTNVSAACTPPISQWRANRYLASRFAADNTQMGKASQTPDSHNQNAQSPVQLSCVHLKQHRQWPEHDGTQKLPPTPRVDYQMRIKPGVIRKISQSALWKWRFN